MIWLTQRFRIFIHSRSRDRDRIGALLISQSTGIATTCTSFASLGRTLVTLYILPEEIPMIIPHADFGAPHCSGSLFGRIAGDQGVIACNECRQSSEESRHASFSDPWMRLNF